MAFPWFALWDRTLDLRKVQRLSGETFKGWINLLCLANRHNDNGRLPCISDIAYALRLDDDKAQSLVDELVEANLIDKKGKIFFIHDWEEHQQRGRTSAERSREWRELQEMRALAKRSESDSENAQGMSHERNTLHNTTLDNTTKTPHAPRKRVVRILDFVLPDSVPENDWNDWLEMRKAKRVPTTTAAMRRACNTLDKLKSEGHSPSDVLQQSTMRGWTGLFPIAVPFHQNGANGYHAKSPDKPRSDSIPHAAGGPQKRPAWIDDPKHDGDPVIEQQRAEWTKKGFPKP